MLIGGVGDSRPPRYQQNCKKVDEGAGNLVSYRSYSFLGHFRTLS